MAFQTFLEHCKENTPVLRTSVLKNSFKNVPEGLIIECGVFTGRSINTIAECFSNRIIHGFDSFDWGTARHQHV
jgi:hypothetical protein